METRKQSNKEEIIPLDKYDRFDRFILEYADFLGGGPLPTGISADLKYSYELQKIRLQKNGVSIKTQVESRWQVGERLMVRSWKDRKYEGKLNGKSVRMKRTFLCDKKKAYHVDGGYSFHETVMDLQEDSRGAHVIYNCPTCGAPLEIMEFVNQGCPYCKSRYSRTQLFPYVTNTFMVEHTYKTGKEFKKAVLLRILTTIPIALLVCTVVFISEYLKNTGQSVSLMSVINGLGRVFSGRLSEILGSAAIMLLPLALMITFLRIVLWLIGYCFRYLPSFWTVFTHKRYEEKMKESFPDYSIEYLKDKVISLYRTLIFSPGRTNYLLYEGEPLPQEWEKILHSEFIGGLGIRGVYQEGNLCFADCVAYADNYWKKGNGIKKETDEIALLLCRDVTKEVSLDFSPFKISCPCCGASFDAMKDRKCPYCGQEYKNDYTEWTVRSMTVRKQRLTRKTRLIVLGVLLVLAIEIVYICLQLGRI